jgi:hypothetical protein
MAVISSDLYLYRAAVNSDAGSNGGKISTTEIVSAVINNLFPNLKESEWTAGKTDYRKAFLRNKNAGDLAFNDCFLWIETPSPADDYLFLHVGTDTDDQDDIDGETDWKASGVFDASASPTDTSIDVEFPSAAGVQDGDFIRLVDSSDNVEVVEVDGTVSWTGAVATIPLASGITGTYAAGDLAAVMIDLGDLEPGIDTAVVTSAGSGDWDDDTGITLYNVGTISEAWTITFTSATDYSVSGAAVGVIGTGSTSSDSSFSNGGSYYFQILSAGFSGTFAAGDEITFNTTHAGAGFWIKRVCPALSSAYSNAAPSIKLTGESA